MKRWAIFTIIFVSLNLHSSTKQLSKKQVDALKQMIQEMDQKNPGLNTHAFIIANKNQILFEDYQKEFTADKMHLLWSISKTFTGLLAGILYDQQLLDPNEYIKDVLTEQKDLINQDLLKKNLQIKHLLTMTSGLDFKEKYESSPLNSDVINMLYLSGNKDMGQFTLDRPMKHAPGTSFNYSSGDTNILMKLLKRKLGKDYLEFIRKNLFEKMGITKYLWETDQTGSIVGSSYLYLTPVDLIKVSQMVLNSGVYQGKRVISKDWIQKSTHILDEFSKHKLKEPFYRSYGFQFWLNEKRPEMNIFKEISTAPSDMAIMKGHEGQRVFILPTDNLIVLRLASDKPGAKVDYNQVFKFLGQQNLMTPQPQTEVANK
jgi:CubicO group peptidase (beta-lactamase class C family)